MSLARRKPSCGLPCASTIESTSDDKPRSFAVEQPVRGEMHVAILAQLAVEHGRATASENPSRRKLEVFGVSASS